MKKLIPVILAGFAGVAAASDTVIYSTTEYCQLVKNESTVLDKNYNRAYAKKLGQTPTRALCKSINAEEERLIVSNDDRWDFRQNRLSDGSIIRLSDRQVAKLRQNKFKPRDVF